MSKTRLLPKGSGIIFASPSDRLTMSWTIRTHYDELEEEYRRIARQADELRNTGQNATENNLPKLPADRNIRKSGSDLMNGKRD
ncbi:MAG: hypothetical protein B6245_03585 [Desulfobacteraceae bacterium 4572_88]|nr:MAG: hypothetical protein B6245_03585 [Desulfobacteraceae bacterium 4572_88]